MKTKLPARLASLVLCLCLLLGVVPVYADSLSGQDAVDLVFDRIYYDFFGQDVPPWNKTAVAGFTDEEVIQYFVEVTMYGEYEGYRGFLLRYEEPIKYMFMGSPDEADKQTVRRLAAALNDVPGFPGISETEVYSDAQMHIMFSDLDTYEDYFDISVPYGSWGYSSVWYYTDSIWRGEMSATHIWISPDAWPRLDRDSVICEEFIQGLGMLNDPEYGFYSIFDQHRNDCDWPSELDWAVVRLLYEPRMDRFSTEAVARETAQAILNSWK